MLHNLNTLLSLNLEAYIPSENIPQSAGPLTKSNIVRLLNFFSKPRLFKYFINRDLYDTLIKQFKNNNFAKIKNSTILLLQSLGYVNVYNDDFFKFVMYNKILITAVHKSLSNLILVDREIKNEKTKLEFATEITKTFANDRSSYPILFALELLPNDTSSLLADNITLIKEIDDKELIALYLTPNLVYLQFITELLVKTHQSLYNVAYYTDAIVYLFLFMRYNVITNYIQEYKAIKYPAIKFDYKKIYDLYLKDYVEEEINRMLNYTVTFKPSK